MAKRKRSVFGRKAEKQILGRIKSRKLILTKRTERRLRKKLKFF